RGGSEIGPAKFPDVAFRRSMIKFSRTLDMKSDSSQQERSSSWTGNPRRFESVKTWPSESGSWPGKGGQYGSCPSAVKKKAF
ncbi:hypothetical protein AVEN_241620-1, partial [Araneus ventricosus]